MAEFKLLNSNAVKGSITTKSLPQFVIENLIANLGVLLNILAAVFFIRSAVMLYDKLAKIYTDPYIALLILGGYVGLLFGLISLISKIKIKVVGGD